MKTSLVRTLTFGTLLLTFTLSSCADPYGYGSGYGGGGYGNSGYGGYGGQPRGAQGTVVGAMLGAAAGGIIGNQSHRGLQGAAIGGILGALAGNAFQGSRRPQQYSQSNYSSGSGYGNQGYSQGYSQPSYQQGYGYGQQNGYNPNYGYGQQGGYSQQPNSNPYAFGNWQ